MCFKLDCAYKLALSTSVNNLWRSCYWRDLILSNLGLCIKLLWMFLMSSTAVHSKLELQNKASDHSSHHWALLNVYRVNIILLSLQLAAKSVNYLHPQTAICHITSAALNYQSSWHLHVCWLDGSCNILQRDSSCMYCTLKRDFVWLSFVTVYAFPKAVVYIISSPLFYSIICRSTSADMTVINLFIVTS